MTVGLVGKKCGMTRVFTDQGESIPVTVLEVKPNRIVQIKTKEVDGYNAVQVTIGNKHLSRINKPTAGHFAKAKVEPGEGLWEMCLDDDKEGAGFSVGSEIKLDIFKVGQEIDVQGVTRGKGFAGVIKRYHFASQDASHGNSLSHRAPGSIGQRQTPGRVFKGKKMCGHLGDAVRTIQSQIIVKIDLERSLLLIKGGVPGAPGGKVIIKPAVKARGEGDAA
jgi:large subunit ribosomal protein L3